MSFVVSSTDDYKTIDGVTQKILDAARKSSMFYYVDTDLKFTSPQLNIDIDQNKAQQLGISMQDAGQYAQRDAGRRLSELLQPARPQLQGHPAGGRQVPPQR